MKNVLESGGKAVEKLILDAHVGCMSGEEGAESEREEGNTQKVQTKRKG